jgi:hypothetical protein
MIYLVKAVAYFVHTGASKFLGTILQQLKDSGKNVEIMCLETLFLKTEAHMCHKNSNIIGI